MPQPESSQSRVIQARTLLALLLMAGGIALLVYDLDHVPLVSLAAALAAFAAGATLLSRPAR